MLIHCKNCSAKLRLPDNYHGQELRCPHCQFIVKTDDELQPVAECEHCWVEFRVKMSLMGERLKCPECKRITKIVPKSPRIPVWCDSCDKSISVPQKMVGWTIRCHACKATIRVVEREVDEFLKYQEEHSGDYFVVNNIADLTNATKVKAKSTNRPDDEDKGDDKGQESPGYHKLMPVMTRDLNLKGNPNANRPRPKPKPSSEELALRDLSSSQSQIVDLTPEVYRSEDSIQNAPRLVVRMKNKPEAPQPPSKPNDSSKVGGAEDSDPDLALDDSSSFDFTLSARDISDQPSFSVVLELSDSNPDSEVDLSDAVDQTVVLDESDDSELSLEDAQSVAASSSQSKFKVRFKSGPQEPSETLVGDSKDTQSMEDSSVKTTPPVKTETKPVESPPTEEVPQTGYKKKRDSPFENIVVKVIAGVVALSVAIGGFYIFSNYINESRKDRDDPNRIERKLLDPDAQQETPDDA